MLEIQCRIHSRLWFDVGKDRYTARSSMSYLSGQLWFDVGKDRYTALKHSHLNGD